MSQYFPLSCPNAHGAGIGTLSWTKIASTGMPGFTGPFPSTSLDKANGYSIVNERMLSAHSPPACISVTGYVNTAPQARQTIRLAQLVDLDLIALQDCISCHSERSGEPEFEESRNSRTLDSSSRSLS